MGQDINKTGEKNSNHFSSLTKRNEKRINYFFLIAMPTLLVWLVALPQIIDIPYWLSTFLGFFLLYTVGIFLMLYKGLVETKAEMKTLFYRYIGLSVLMMAMLSGLIIYHLN